MNRPRTRERVQQKPVFIGTRLPGAVNLTRCRDECKVFSLWEHCYRFAIPVGALSLIAIAAEKCAALSSAISIGRSAYRSVSRSRSSAIWLSPGSDPPC
jgi:hypothetical protein